MPGNFINSQEVKFIPFADVLNLARNAPDQGRAKHIIFHMLRFFTRLMENFEIEQLLRNFIVEKGWD